MSRRLTFFGFFVVFSVAVIQLSTAQTSSGYVPSGVPAVSGTTIFVGQGPSTPSVTYAAPAPTAGISDAGRAGISNTAPTPEVLPPSTGTVVYYGQPGVETIVTSPTAPGFVAPVTGVTENPAPIETVPAEAPAEGNPGQSAQTNAPDQNAKNGVGPMQYLNAPSNASVTSLGEISARFKTDKSVHNARLLTNEDALRLRQTNSDVTVAGNLQPVNPNAAAPVDNGQTQPAPAPTQSAQNNASPDNNQQQAPANNAQNSAGATTPEINQNQQNNDSSGSGSLPATATFLPLFGVLGLASGGVGLWFRKFRK